MSAVAKGHWSPADVATLRAAWPTMEPLDDLAARLRRPRDKVVDKARGLGPVRGGGVGMGCVVGAAGPDASVAVAGPSVSLAAMTFEPDQHSDDCPIGRLAALVGEEEA